MVNTANARSCRKKKGFLRDSLNASGAWKIVTVLICQLKRGYSGGIAGV
jgi:hypothetical protein